LFPQTHLALDLLCDSNVRDEAKVHAKKNYIFANTGITCNHVEGYDTIDYVVAKHGGIESKINATNNQIRLSTLYAAVNVDENRQFFYKHLGHSKSVNEGVYQLAI
jgi:hypothetical protein